MITLPGRHNNPKGVCSKQQNVCDNRIRRTDNTKHVKQKTDRAEKRN